MSSKSNACGADARIVESPTRARWLAVSYTIAVMVVLFAPTPSTVEFPEEWQMDKCVHAVLFALHFMVWAAALQLFPRSLLFACAITMCFAVFTEVVQGWLPYRSADYHDLLADGIGAAIGTIGVTISRRRQSRDNAAMITSSSAAGTR